MVPDIGAALKRRPDAEGLRSAMGVKSPDAAFPPGYAVQGVESSSGGILGLCTVDVGSRCVCGGNPVPGGVFRTLFVNDMPWAGRPAGLCVRQGHMYCPHCGARNWETLPGVVWPYRITERLLRFIVEAGAVRPISDVVRETGVSARTVRNIWRDFAWRRHPPQALVLPEASGIFCLPMARKTRQGLLDCGTGRILDIFVTQRALVDALAASNPERCRVMSVLMSDGLIDSLAQVVSRSRLVIPWLELMPAANAAVAVILGEVRAGIGAGREYQLRGSRSFLRRLPDGQSTEDEGKLDRWMKEFPDLEKVWSARAGLLAIADAPDARTAVRRYRQWLRGLDGLRKAFRQVISGVERRERELFRAFDAPAHLRNENLIGGMRRFAAQRPDREGFHLQRSLLLDAYGEPRIGSRGGDAGRTILFTAEIAAHGIDTMC